MRKTINAGLFLLATTILLSSCVSKKKFDQLTTDKAEVDQLLSETRTKVSELETEVSTLTDANSDLESKNSDLSTRVASLDEMNKKTQAEMTTMKGTMDAQSKELNSFKNAMKEAFSAIEASGLNIKPHGNRLYVMMEEPITYRSGSTRVAGKFRENLKQLAEVLKNNPSLAIQVEGHTDSKKMIEGARFVDNWDLSTARATNVVRMLIKHGVNPTQVSAVGKGEHLPAYEEDTAENRKKNRRVEFVVLPKVSALYKAGA